MLEFALSLAREAGEILMRAHGGVDRTRIGYKGWRNLVTETDVAGESCPRESRATKETLAAPGAASPRRGSTRRISPPPAPPRPA